MSEEITSPPFPNDTTTLPRLLQHLSDLRVWVIDLRFWANETVSGLGSPAPLIPEEEEIPQIPDLQRMHMISIPDIMGSYIGMRTLREQWDGIVRTFEDNWDCRHAIKGRLQAIRIGYNILNDAFVSPEQREARREATFSKMRKTMKDVMRKIGVPEEMLGSGSGVIFGPGGMMIEMNEKEGDVDKLSKEELDELFNPKMDDGDSDSED